MKFKALIHYSVCLSFLAMLSACGSSDNDAIVNNDTTDSLIVEKNANAQKIFAAMPSPIETTKLLQEAGAKYNAKYLNPIENVSKYSSITAKAINLGIYGSDLSFTSVFSQTQESMLYLRCTNTLANSLGITGAFDERTTSRIEANLESKDSLLKIISESYWNSDTYLRENGQAGVSALIVAGGWIEGLHIATQVANKTQNPTIIARIVEQKPSLDNLVALLDAYKSENTGIADVLAHFQALKVIFDNVTAKPEVATATTDSTGTAVAVASEESTNTSAGLTANQLKEISDKTAEIRNTLIK